MLLSISKKSWSAINILANGYMEVLLLYPRLLINYALPCNLILNDSREKEKKKTWAQLVNDVQLKRAMPILVSTVMSS